MTALEIFKDLNVQVLLILWVAGHGMVFFLVRDTNRLPAIALMGVFLVALLLLKPPTYDLEKYSIFFQTGFWPTTEYTVQDSGILLSPSDMTGEPYTFGNQIANQGFALLMETMGKILPKGSYLTRLVLPGYESWFIADSFSLGIIGIGVFALLYLFGTLPVTDQCISLGVREKQLLLVGLILGSLFFLLGSQNGVRQFIAFSIIAVGFSLILREKWKSALVTLVLAQFFHHWAWVFCLGLLAYLFIHGVLDLVRRRYAMPRLFGIEILALGAGGGLTLLLILAIRLQNTTGPLGEILLYGAQLDFSGHIERITIYKKIILLGVALLVSEFIAGRARTAFKFSFRQMRRSIFLFLLPVAYFPEIFSRLLYFYFFIELGCIVALVLSSSIRARMAGAFIFVTYAVAPNAINIIIGPSWRYAMQ